MHYIFRFSDKKRKISKKNVVLVRGKRPFNSSLHDRYVIKEGCFNRHLFATMYIS